MDKQKEALEMLAYLSPMKINAHRLALWLNSVDESRALGKHMSKVTRHLDHVVKELKDKWDTNAVRNSN